MVRRLHDAYPEWVARDDLGTGLLHGNVPAATLGAVLGSLAARNLVEQRRVETEGRPREEFRLARPPQLALFP